ncbi:MAG: hypothetical protein LBD25_07405, partial [Coriobacteriales bacterium]|nr:hypothetical protein [Coriobacteriales bacterium]
RNSGVTAVVEGVGDHGCEYMTGGRVLILGPVGRNFGAGMSGGVAYVLDEAGDFAGRCSTGNLSVKKLDIADTGHVQEMLERHHCHTGSVKAHRLLDDFSTASRQFVKIVPHDYQNVLEAMEQARQGGMDDDEAMLFAYNAVVASKRKAG